jgi:P27 family predicted phage terminase small subunit
MGRNQDPPELHVLKGTKSRVKKQTGTLEPLTRLWRCPEHVHHPAAKKMFKNLGGLLIEKRMLTALDHAAFEILCSSWGHVQQARETLEVEGMVINDKRGALKIHPANRVMAIFQKHFDWGCGQFGLTPASRKRLNLKFEKPEPENPFDDFMKKRKNRKKPKLD